MAPTTLSCGATTCEFVTAEAEPEVAIQLLAFHRQAAHMQVQPQAVGQAVPTKPQAEKITRPVVNMGIGQDEFSYFKNRWTSYNSELLVMKTFKKIFTAPWVQS